MARASVLSLERTFEFLARARVPWLEREFLCLVARATKSSLERACFISADSSVFEHHFFTPFFFLTLDPRLSLSKLTFSLRIDLPRAFVKKIEGVESFVLI